MKRLRRIILNGVTVFSLLLAIATAGLRRLFVLRSRRRWWAYIPWLIVATLTSLIFNYDTPFSYENPRSWFSILPLFVVTTQCIYPTLAGWLILLLPTLWYLTLCVYYYAETFTGPFPLWSRDPSSAILATVFLMLLVAGCLPLFFGRPRLRVPLPGLCAACGYDMRANLAKCSECGHEPVGTA